MNYFRQNNAGHFAPITLKIPWQRTFAPAKNGRAALTSASSPGEVKDSLGTTAAAFFAM